MLACQAGHYDIVEELVEHKANVNAKEKVKSRNREEQTDACISASQRALFCTHLLFVMLITCRLFVCLVRSNSLDVRLCKRPLSHCPILIKQ